MILNRLAAGSRVLRRLGRSGNGQQQHLSNLYGSKVPRPPEYVSLGMLKVVFVLGCGIWLGGKTAQHLAQISNRIDMLDYMDEDEDDW